MERPKYSVIIPFHIWSDERQKRFDDCLKSVLRQKYSSYEVVLVDDGSPMTYKIPDFPSLQFIKQDHLERVVAFNKGFQMARGEWFIVLDSDDELVDDVFLVYDKAIEKNPKYKLFNFAVKYASKEGKDKDWVRGPFEPKTKKTGHEIFGGGNIVNGSFIWNHSVYEKLGGFPENCYERKHKDHLGKNLHMTSPWDFSVRFQELYPEVKKYFQVTNEDHPKGYPKELGNPWGQDYALFYKYTRKYHSLPISEVTHYIHPR